MKPLALFIFLVGCMDAIPNAPAVPDARLAAVAVPDPDAGTMALPDATVPGVMTPDAAPVPPDGPPADLLPPPRMDAAGSFAPCPANQSASLCQPFFSNPSCAATPSPYPCRTLTWDCSLGPCGLVSIVVSDCQFCLLSVGAP